MQCNERIFVIEFVTEVFVRDKYRVHCYFHGILNIQRTEFCFIFFRQKAECFSRDFKNSKTDTPSIAEHLLRSQCP